METDENNVPLSLPDTQNADSECFTQSQDTLTTGDSHSRVWGRLCPHDSNLQTVGKAFMFKFKTFKIIIYFTII
jgi:hypothetical protein